MAADDKTSPGATAAKTTVLVTGAAGGIGQVVVGQLLEKGYRIRAVTSKSPAPVAKSADIEWRTFDLLKSEDYDALVAGCDAVLHIAAEMGEPANMWRANVEATGLLAAAAERAGVKAFCYTSSVAVYGSGLKRRMDEQAPVLTIDEDVSNEYWGNDAIRTYGRTKLGGERSIRQAARAVRYAIFRPASVVSVAGLIDIRDWSRSKLTIAAHRHAHHVYVGDVADAIIWAMERALQGVGAPGSIELFNLAEDEFAEPTHAQFLRKAYAASGDRRYRVPTLPWVIDWFRDFARFRRLPLRNPLWRMRFPNDRLVQAGYRFRYGMAWAHDQALKQLRSSAQ